MKIFIEISYMLSICNPCIMIRTLKYDFSKFRKLFSYYDDKFSHFLTILTVHQNRMLVIRYSKYVIYKKYKYYLWFAEINFTFKFPNLKFVVCLQMLCSQMTYLKIRKKICIIATFFNKNMFPMIFNHQ